MAGIEATSGVGSQASTQKVSVGEGTSVQPAKQGFAFDKTFAEILKKVFGDDGKAPVNAYLA